MDGDLLSAAFGAVVALIAVGVTAGIENRRSQQLAMKQTWRLLASLNDAVDKEERPRGGQTPIEAYQATQQVMRDVVISIPDLPRRVSSVVDQAIEVVDERHDLDMHPTRPTGTATREAIGVLRAARESSWFRWWFFRRWRRARMPEPLVNYLQQIPQIREQREEMYEAQKLESAERRRHELGATNVASQDGTAP